MPKKDDFFYVHLFSAFFHPYEPADTFIFVANNFFKP